MDKEWRYTWYVFCLLIDEKGVSVYGPLTETWRHVNGQLDALARRLTVNMTHKNWYASVFFFFFFLPQNMPAAKFRAGLYHLVSQKVADAATLCAVV